jgi:hypothetical protein
MCNLEFTLLDFREVDAMISSARGGRNAWASVYLNKEVVASENLDESERMWLVLAS